MSGMDFFRGLDELLGETGVVVDRPKGSSHPRYPRTVYPIDYGHLPDTGSIDGGGIDVFVGGASGQGVTAVYFTLDRTKRDLEAKVLVDCSEDEITKVGRFLRDMHLTPLLARRP